MRRMDVVNQRRRFGLTDLRCIANGRILAREMARDRKLTFVAYSISSTYGIGWLAFGKMVHRGARKTPKDSTLGLCCPS
jgi:hypothetical protein